MSTPHNAAEPGQIAKTVLMPGDPLRAKYIVENYLENAELVSDVRGIFAYTGYYKGHRLSVMAHGMGIPSIGIYSYELFSHYDVDRIIRIGSAGSYSPDLNLFDVVLVKGAISESTYAKIQNGYNTDITYPTPDLVDKLRSAADKLGTPVTEGNVHCCDVFYRENDGQTPAYWEVLRDTRNCVAVEMESFALFHNANVLQKQAACVLTISDSFITPQKATAEERRTGFHKMMQTALEAAIAE